MNNSFSQQLDKIRIQFYKNIALPLSNLKLHQTYHILAFRLDITSDLKEGDLVSEFVVTLSSIKKDSYKFTGKVIDCNVSIFGKLPNFPIHFTKPKSSYLRQWVAIDINELT